jgi:hypothetical protein
MVLGTLEILSEAYTMASKTDIESARVFELIQGTLLASGGMGADSSFRQMFYLPRCNSKHTY